MFGDPIKLTIAQLAKNRLFMKLLRWDVTPEVLFKPRFVDKPEDARPGSRAAESPGSW
jgi:hypothetical protein